MQYLVYPVKKMAISQSYNGAYSHKAESTGVPVAYPIDECCGDSARSYFYAPCDLIIRRIYGVGNKGTNTIWLESLNKVKLANGKESIVTIRVTHPEDDDLKNYKVGQKITQYTKMFREGKDGDATGNHFHIEVNTCEFKKLTGNGWVKNSKGGWTTAPNSIKPEEAFYIDTSFTTIKTSAGLKFKNMPKVTTSQPIVTYYKKYTGKSNSLVDALKSLKIDSSFSNRGKIARKNGISIYLGTASQNIKLLDLLKKGKLVK